MGDTCGLLLEFLVWHSGAYLVSIHHLLHQYMLMFSHQQKRYNFKVLRCFHRNLHLHPQYSSASSIRTWGELVSTESTVAETWLSSSATRLDYPHQQPQEVNSHEVEVWLSPISWLPDMLDILLPLSTSMTSGTSSRSLPHSIADCWMSCSAATLVPSSKTLPDSFCLPFRRQL